ncbi:Retrovirus-related Pol polyprotein [Thelohanellus kitauei]|uniref:Retrovirus-related Pol polyprotein n=1 Tax=Thelohanellus kitauei TaxID=669202 RepID=A0A0C2MKL6_THEKT|nr:Retrovirus-related Pol polyprotein [Thelohanellus kitauei]
MSQSWRRPQNTKDVLRFLGFCNYYRSSIKNYALHEIPLRKISVDSKQFHWSLELERAFNELKKALITAPVLEFPNHNLKFILDVYASDSAIGAVLSQINNEGSETVIRYASKTFNDVERRYSAIRKELMSVVWSFKKFRPYLFGAKLIMITDHRPLQSIKKKGDIGGPTVRWLDLIAEDDFEIQHRPGKNHTNADASSRCCSLQHQELVNEINANSLEWSLEDIRRYQQDDVIRTFLRDIFSKSRQSIKSILSMNQ